MRQLMHFEQKGDLLLLKYDDGTTESLKLGGMAAKPDEEKEDDNDQELMKQYIEKKKESKE